MKEKEIIYIQAGTLANYTGTHFWNTQQSYFTYGDDAPEPLTAHDVSFRAGMDYAGGATYCPRVLVIDKKSRFRGLAGETVLGGAEDEGDESIWGGEVAEYRLNEDEVRGPEVAQDTQNPGVSRIKHWSDFGEVAYLPRSLHAIPDAAGWEEGTNWDEGKRAFSRYDEEHDLMDGAFRQFLEECDSPQGVQLMNDTEDFGAFTYALLVALGDEHPKMPCLAFSFLSIPTSQQIDSDDYGGIRKPINDALYLRGLSELSVMNVPIQPPAAWPQGGWGSADQVKDSPYLSSVVASALIETATLPLRLIGAQETIASVYSQLNVRGPPLAQLSGNLPVRTSADLSGPLPKYSLPASSGEDTPGFYARRDITRGFSSSLLSAYEEWSSQSHTRGHTHLSSTHAVPPYPLPTHHSPIFPDADLGPTAVLASMSTSSRVRGCLAAYARRAESGARGMGVGAGMTGLDKDELKELASDLWAMHDSVGGGDDESGGGSAGSAGSVGEDEE